MPRMTEAEAWVLEDEVTKNPPVVDLLKARYSVRLTAEDDFSADWKDWGQSFDASIRSIDSKTE